MARSVGLRVADVTGARVAVAERAALVRRGTRLAAITVAYNSLEGVLSIAAGVLAGSVALVGFGVDSAIELAAGAAALRGRDSCGCAATG